MATSSRRGGGVAVLDRDTFATKILPSPHCNTFELLRVQFSAAHSISFNVCVVYHPPASSRLSGTSSELYTELECIFTEASVSVISTIIVGDFNIHFDDVTKSEPLRYLLDGFNLLQRVNSPTHKTGHTLGLILFVSIICTACFPWLCYELCYGFVMQMFIIVGYTMYYYLYNRQE